jgi:hypothetical protein
VKLVTLSSPEPSCPLCATRVVLTWVSSETRLSSSSVFWANVEVIWSLLSRICASDWERPFQPAASWWVRVCRSVALSPRTALLAAANRSP